MKSTDSAPAFAYQPGKRPNAVRCTRRKHSKAIGPMLNLNRPGRSLLLVAALSAVITLDAASALAADLVRPEEIIVAGAIPPAERDAELDAELRRARRIAERDEEIRRRPAVLRSSMQRAHSTISGTPATSHF